jgi:ankyrin repeat protein
MKQAAMFGRLKATQNFAQAFNFMEGQNRHESDEAVAAFQVAVLHGHYKVADFLAEKCGAHPDMQPNDRTVPASAWALREGDLKKISYLVDKGANPSYMLVHAVNGSANSKKIIDLLLRKGADVNYAQEGFWTPFLQAVKYRRFDLADYLLTKGATPETDKSGMEALLNIVEAKAAGLPMLDKILARGLRPDADMVLRAMHADNLEAAEKMLEKGVNVRQYGGGMLITAVLSPRADEAVQLCLKYGADPKQALETALRPKQSWERSPHQDKIVAALETLVAAEQDNAKPAAPQAQIKPPRP